MAKTEYIAIHKAADYYEPLFRANFVRAIKRMRSSLTIASLARAIQQRHPQVLSRQVIQQALAPAEKIVRDAVRRGGQLGAERLRKLR